MRRLVACLTVTAALVAAPLVGPDVSQAASPCARFTPLLAANHLPVATFARIMFRESRCQPGAVNRRSGARGLLQIMPYVARAACSGLNTGTARGNVACAARLYHRAGLRPWR
jgi:soluble lytic murein transglycosylase-like protein